MRLQEFGVSLSIWKFGVRANPHNRQIEELSWIHFTISPSLPNICSIKQTFSNSFAVPLNKNVDPLLSPLESFRSHSRSARIHPTELLLLIVVGFNVCLLPWEFGGMPFWSEWLSLILSLFSIAFALIPRTYKADENRDGSNFRLLMLPKLFSFPIFWIGLLFLAYVLCQAVNTRYSYRQNGVDWWIVPVAHIDFLPSGISSPSRIMSAWRMLVLYSSVWLTVCSIWVGFTRRKSMLSILTILCVNAFFLALLGVSERALNATKIYWFWSAPAPYFVSSFIYKNHAGAYFNLMLSAACGIAYWHYLRAQRRMEKSNPGPVFAFIAILLGTTVIFSYSRAATILMVGFLAAILGIFLIKELVFSSIKKRTPWVIVLLFPIFGAFIVLALNMLHSSDAYTKMEMLIRDDAGGSVAGRVLAEQATEKMLGDSPLFGWGAGSFRFRFPSYQANYPKIFESNGRRLYWEHAHNDYLELLAEVGVVGFACLLIGQLYWFMKLLALHFWGNPISLVIVLGAITLLLHSLVDFQFYNPAILMTWCIFWPIAVKWVECEDSAG